MKLTRSEIMIVFADLSDQILELFLFHLYFSLYLIQIN